MKPGNFSLFLLFLTHMLLLYNTWLVFFLCIVFQCLEIFGRMKSLLWKLFICSWFALEIVQYRLINIDSQHQRKAWYFSKPLCHEHVTNPWEPAITNHSFFGPFPKELLKVFSKPCHTSYRPKAAGWIIIFFILVF